MIDEQIGTTHFVWSLRQIYSFAIFAFISQMMNALKYTDIKNFSFHANFPRFKFQFQYSFIIVHLYRHIDGCTYVLSHTLRYTENKRQYIQTFPHFRNTADWIDCVLQIERSAYKWNNNTMIDAFNYLIWLYTSI